ncbi:MAG: GNAT family N-acetyltransferase [Candidatus Saccharibacteria bacterium]
MTRYLPVLSDETTLPSDRLGFIRAYQEAFGGPPYNEQYSDDDVLDHVWHPHVEDGIVILAIENEKVVGFGCALPVLKAPDEVQRFLSDSEHYTGDLQKTWYMSELGVINTHRGRGIAYELVRHRMLTICHRGDMHYAFRTAAMGSNSIHLYRKIGAQEIPELQNVGDTDQVVVNGSESTQRVYLFGDIADALTQLPS